MYPGRRLFHLPRLKGGQTPCSTKRRYIVVEGPIGAGKTTLAKRLAERINADVLLENPAANLLGRFYQNMERWGCPPRRLPVPAQRKQLAASRHHRPGPPRGVRLPARQDPLFAELNLADDELRSTSAAL